MKRIAVFYDDDGKICLYFSVRNRQDCCVHSDDGSHHEWTGSLLYVHSNSLLCSISWLMDFYINWITLRARFGIKMQKKVSMLINILNKIPLSQYVFVTTFVVTFFFFCHLRCLFYLIFFVLFCFFSRQNNLWVLTIWSTADYICEHFEPIWI